jgi:hypothetical protein
MRPAGCFALAASLLWAASSHAVPRQIERLPGREGVIAFEVSFEDPEVDTVEIGGRLFAAVRVGGASEIAPPGAPDLPARLLLAAVADGAGVTVTAEPLGERVITTLPPLAVPRLERTDSGNGGSWRFAGLSDPDPALFRGTSPAAPAWLHSLTRVRDLPVARIAVSPLRYDARSGRVTFAPRVRVEVRTRGGSGAMRLTPSAGAAFEAMFEELLVNPEDAPRFRVFDDRAGRAGPAEGDYFRSTGNPWVKIFTAARGMYRVTYEALVSAGIDAGSLDPATVRLYGGGGLVLDEDVDVLDLPGWMEQVAVEVEDSDGVFGAGDAFVFFGQGVDGWADDYGRPADRERWLEHEYTSENVYWLTWGGTWNEPVRRISPRAVPPSTAPPLRAFDERVHYERNREHDTAPWENHYRWEKWWYQLLSDQPNDPERTYGATLTDPDTTAAMRLWARFWGANVSNGYVRDHFLRVTVNGELVDSRSWDYIRRQDVVVSGTWGRRSNVMGVTVPTQIDTTNDNRVDQVLLAWYEFDYTRRLRAPDGLLEFSSPESPGPVTMAVTGLVTGAPHRLFDITDRFAPVSLTGTVVSASTDADSLAFTDPLGGSPRRYLLVRPTKYLAPARIAADALPVSLLRERGDRVDYIIITHESFGDAAALIRDLRGTRIQGIADPRVAVVGIQDVYDEFSWGLPDVSAIRNFLEWAYLHWNGGDPGVHPTYALLLGDATFDPRDFDRNGATSYVLAYGNARGTDFGLGTPQYVTDDWFAYFDGPFDEVAEMIVGRLPAATTAEANAMAAKTVRYETQPLRDGWAARTLVVADDICQAGHPDGLGYTHTRQSESLERYYIPRPLDRVKLYLLEYGSSCSMLQKPAAQADLVDRIEEGAWILNFIGHGGSTQLADERVLARENVAGLTNLDRLPFFLTASCTVGKVDSEEEGLGEAMVKHANGGSVATFAATQLASAVENERLNKTVMQLLFPRGPALADTITTVGFATVTAKNTVRLGTSFRYLLQGDPALVLAVPDLRVDVSMTHAAPLRPGAVQDTLRRGEIVHVSGVVRGPAGDVASDFNGRAAILASDSEILRRSVPGDALTYYYLPGPAMYRGDVPVAAGQFDATFVVPWSTNSDPRGFGRIRAYVTSSSTDGIGVLDSLFISTDAVSAADTSGPVIEFVDFTGGTLRAGERLAIRLEDPSGINITQFRIDLSVTVVIEDRFGNSVTDPADLTPQLTFVDGYQEGEVVFTVPSRPALSPGQTYTLVVRAADSYNNRSSLRREFTFAVEGPLRILRAFNFPNPTPGETRIFIEPSSDAADVTVKILTVSGRAIRTLRGAVSAGQWLSQPVEWDGRDAEGDPVANGVYFYKVEARSADNGSSDSVIGKAVVSR